MQPRTIYDEQDYRHSLSRLFWLRNTIIFTLLLILFILVLGLSIPLDLPPLLGIVIALVLMNLFVLWRLKPNRVISRIEIAINLTIDTLFLSAILYFTGGSTNPLVSLFIIPVALSAVFLPIHYIVWFVSLTIALYTLLMDQYISLPPMGSRFGGDFNLHIIGMYANFIFSAIIIAIFVYTLARTGRRHERGLAHAKEKLIRNQHIVEMGLLSANAAHEISTPLSTINLLAEELLVSDNSKTQIIDDVTEIQKQVQYCKNSLEVLQQTALSSEKSTDSVPLKQGLNQIIDQWDALNSEIIVNQDIQLKNETLVTLHSLKLALINLMTNAAEASLKARQTKIKVSVRCKSDTLIIDVDDYGEGLTEQQLALIGKKPYSSKPEGLGIGLLLSHTSLDQIGGTCLLNNHNSETHQTGIRARITLPLEKLLV